MILVTFAVPFESAAFRASQLGNRTTEIRCLHTGVGAKAARRCVESALAAEIFSHVIVSGFAGGLATGLEVGDLITTTKRELAGISGLDSVKTVRLVESDRILENPAAKRAFADRTGGEAVDMETETILAVCRDHGVPAFVLRVISDDANSSLVVPAEILADATRRPIQGTLRLLGHLVLRPARWRPFRTMVTGCHRARANLGLALSELTENQGGSSP